MGLQESMCTFLSIRLDYSDHPNYHDYPDFSATYCYICVHRDPKGMFSLMGATGLSAPKSGGHSHGRSPLHSKEHAYKIIDKLNTQQYA